MKADLSSFAQSFHLKSGIDIYIDSYVSSARKEQSPDLSLPVFSFNFHKSEYKDRSSKTLVSSHSYGQIENSYCGSFSSIVFNPESIEKMDGMAEDRQLKVHIIIRPILLNVYLGGRFDSFPEDLKAILEKRAYKSFSHIGPICWKMNMVIQNLLDCPYEGAVKELFINSKVIELIMLKLAQTISLKGTNNRLFNLKSEEVDYINNARDILHYDLANTPKLSDLAKAVGTNHCKLNMGFRELYGTTVFGYLRQERLKMARRLLEGGNNVTDAAFSVGYNSLPSFSKAFYKYFGINPMMCRRKKYRYM